MSDDSVHILLLSEREVHVLGALYSLGVMAALLDKVVDSDVPERAAVFDQARHLTGGMLELEPFQTLYKSVRDKIVDLATEDHAEREDALGD